MNCLTKLSQKKRVTNSYIRAFLATMISKRDSSDLKVLKRQIKKVKLNTFYMNGGGEFVECQADSPTQYSL